MNQRKLAHIARIAESELSNYDGSFDEFDQFSGGSNLDFVDFDGASVEEKAGAFPQEVKQVKGGQKRMFQFTVSNASTTKALDFYLLEGLNEEMVGTILKDDTALVPIGGGSDTIAVKGLLKDIKYLRNFVRQNPTRVLGFKISASNSLQIETNVSIEVDSPFHTSLKSRQIVLADYQNENTFRDKVVTVPEQFQMDALTKVRMTIAPATSMTVTLYIGAVLSQSKALHKMAAKASGGLDYSSSMLKDKAAAYGLQLGM